MNFLENLYYLYRLLIIQKLHIFVELNQF